MDPAALAKPPMHRVKVFHCEKSALAVPALGPGIGEIDVKCVHRVKRELRQEHFCGGVDDLNVLQAPLLYLLAGAAAAPGLDVNADEKGVGPRSSVGHKEVTVAAADLHFTAVRVARQEVLHPRLGSPCRGRLGTPCQR